MSLADELFEIAAGFEKIAEYGESSEFRDPVKARVAAIEHVAKAHSGSWIGYQARVYQTDFHAVHGAHFDSQWGLTNELLAKHRGSWADYDPEGVKRAIIQLSGSVDFVPIKRKVGELTTTFNDLKSSALSIMETYLASHADEFLRKMKEVIEPLGPVSVKEWISYYSPQRVGSADQVAIGGGIVTPPHVELAAEMSSLSAIFNIAPKFISTIKQAASHMERQLKSAKAQERIGTNVAIGHGRSLMWLQLKEFVKDRLNLPFDEFNRVPVAGVTNTARLLEMLDSAAIAFLIMTAEDETKEGKTQARMNVIHEVGLFQGRLGFTRAIIMLEEGCEEFSNVQGLGQIRFPKGNIKAAFEEVREVLEREGLI